MTRVAEREPDHVEKGIKQGDSDCGTGRSEKADGPAEPKDSRVPRHDSTGQNDEDKESK